MSQQSLLYSPPAPNPIYHAVCRKDHALAAAMGALTLIAHDVNFWVRTHETEDRSMVITVWDYDPGLPDSVAGSFLDDPEEQAEWLMDVGHRDLRVHDS